MLTKLEEISADTEIPLINLTWKKLAWQHKILESSGEYVSFKTASQTNLFFFLMPLGFLNGS